MNALIIEETIQTPHVCFDPDNNIFEIKNKSLPEDADVFYEPIIKWFERYCKQPNEQTDFYFKLDYYNTSSARNIAFIINLLDVLSQKHKVKIFWYYHQIDEDMQSMGEQYYETTQVDFELVKI